MEAADVLQALMSHPELSSTLRFQGQGLRPAPPTIADELRAWQNMTNEHCHIDWQRIVDRQLAPWEHLGIHNHLFGNAYCDVKHVVFVRVVAGQLQYAFYWHAELISDDKQFLTSRPTAAMWLIAMTYARAKARRQPMPDVALVLYANDGAFPRSVSHVPLPMLGSVKCAYDRRHNASVSFPMLVQDHFGLTDGRTTLSLYHHLHDIQRAMGSHPWYLKVNRLFFSAKPQASSRGHRDRIFALRNSTTRYAIYDTNTPLKANGRFRYLVYAQGNMGWSRRLRELALMNATVFVQTSSRCTEYYLDLFTPGQHYVPVAEDFSDLDDQLVNMMHHPEMAETMASAWAALGQEALTLACTLDYVESLLRQYATLQRTRPVSDARWHQYSFERAMRGHLFTQPGPIGGMCDAYTDELGGV